jgi:hypothetical protein
VYGIYLSWTILHFERRKALGYDEYLDCLAVSVSLNS